MATALTGQQVGSAGAYYDDALKEFYLPVIKEQFQKKSVLYQNVKKSLKGLEAAGKYVVGTVSKAGTSGIGAKPEGYILPTKGYERLEQHKTYMRYNYGRIEISGPLLAASRNSRGALAKAFTRETKSATLGMTRDVNRQLFSDGTGKLCLTNGTASSTTLTVDSLFGLGYTSPSATYSPLSATKYLNAGVELDIGDATTYTTIDVDSKTVSTRDSSTQVTLVANSSTWDTNGFPMRADAAANEIMGLRGIIDDNSTGGVTTLQGINRSTSGNSYWNASMVDIGSITAPTSISDSLLQQLISTAEENEGDVGLLVCNFQLRDSIANLLVGDKRFNNTLELKGGFKGITWNDKPIVVDTDCMPYYLFAVDFSTLTNAESMPMGWMDDDGSILHRVTNYDAFEATLRLYSNFYTDRPVSNGCLSFVQ